MPILSNLKVSEVSFCKLGMNQHAKVALFKSQPDPAAFGPGYSLAKATFAEALNGAMVAERVGEAFSNSFDGLWQQNQAFRTALTDELAEGGDGSAASADYISSVNSLVEEAVAAARSAGSDASDADMEKAITEAATSWIAKKQPQPKEHIMNITTRALLKAAVAAFDPLTSPAAHIGIIQKAALELGAEDELPAEGSLAKAKADPAMAKMQHELTVLKMPEDVRKHYDALGEADQPAFIAKSAADQRTEVDAANATDPVLYKSAGGLEIRKSHGDVALALAKQMDEQTAELATLRSGAVTGTLEKRAGSEFPNVAEKVAVDMLKSIAHFGADTDAGKSITASLTAMNKSQDTLFKTLGTTEAPDGPADVAKARTDFNIEVQKIAKRDSVDGATAMTTAREEQPEMFADAYPSSAVAEDA